MKTESTTSPALPSADNVSRQCAPDGASCIAARDVLSRVGEKWTTLIVMLLGNGSMRFSEIRRAAGASQRMLSLTLKNLERDGLVHRLETPTIPPRVDYSLTTLGVSLSAPIRTLGEWARHHHGDIERSRAAFDEEPRGHARRPRWH